MMLKKKSPYRAALSAVELNDNIHLVMATIEITLGMPYAAVLMHPDMSDGIVEAQYRLFADAAEYAARWSNLWGCPFVIVGYDGVVAVYVNGERTTCGVGALFGLFDIVW